VGLEFTEIEAHGGFTPFFADFFKADVISGVHSSLSEHTVVLMGSGDRITKETITLPELPGVASFFVSGESFTIPGGFRTVWRTRGPIRGR